MRDRKNDTHRMQTEARLGRKLGKDEVVHHANEDKSDNAGTNLEVQTRSQHTTQHNRTRNLSKLRAALRMHKEGKRLY